MDRVLVYPNALPRVLDILKTGQFGMVGLAKLAEATLGTATVADGFTCVPTTPASTSIVLSGGQVYEQENLEATNISSLSTDTHAIQKQGVVLDAQQLVLVPPSTPGQAVCALIQVQYFDSDTGQQTLNYYNAANPAVPLVGPSGNKTQNYTIRAGAVNVGVKLGSPVTSGVPTPPSPDAGYVGLFVVTLAYGQTQIQAGNIAPYASAPLIPEKLPYIPTAIQRGKYTYAVDAGAANALNVKLYPAITGLSDGMEITVKPAFTNTATAVTITVNGITANVLRADGTAVAVGDIVAGIRTRLYCDGTNWCLGRAVGSSSSSSSTTVAAVVAFEVAGTFTWVATSTTIDLIVVGGGGSGGGSNTIYCGSAGGGGGRAEKRITGLTIGQSYTIVVGAGGAAAAQNTLVAGVAGGTSSGFSVSATGGAGGQAMTGSSVVSGGAGGLGSGGDRNYYGQDGQASTNANAGNNYPNGGGAVGFTGGNCNQSNGGTSFQPRGPTPGAGGAGGYSANPGGTGHDGAVYIRPL